MSAASPPPFLPPWGRAILTVLAYLAAIAVILAPFAITPVLPLVDYPNHLAKMHLAASLPDNAALAQFYEWRLRFVPNLAQDLIVPPIARVIGTYAALKLFVCWSLVQLILGVALLRYALLGRVGLWPLAAILFLFNKVLWWGFVNYLFASGVVLILFAFWILLERRGPVLRVVVFTALMPVMFFMHLIATALLAVMIGSYEAAAMWRTLAPDFRGRARWLECCKEALITVIPFLSLPVLWALSPTGSREHGFIYLGFRNFAAAILSPFTMTGTTWGVSFAIAVMAFGLLAFFSHQFALARPMRFTLAILFLVSAFMPLEVLDVFGTHFRTPFLFCCIAVAAVEVRHPKPLFVTAAALVIGVLFALRGYGLVTEWSRFDAQLSDYRAAIKKIPPGSTVMPVLDYPHHTAWEGAVRYEIFWHLSALVVIDASSFDPLLFSDPRRQSVAVRPDKRHLDVPVGMPVATEWATEAYRRAMVRAAGGKGMRLKPWPGRDWSRWFEDYDYLLRFSDKSPRDEVVGPLTPLASGAWFDLYRIDRPKGAKAP